METDMRIEPKAYRLSIAQKQQVIETIKKQLTSLDEVRFAFLFGSFVDDPNETSLPFHDIDVGVYLKGIGKKDSVYYALELSDRLSSSVKFPVDVRVLNFAPVTFLFHVVRGRLIVDKDEDDRCTFMERVVRHYLDMKPLFHNAVKEAYGS